MITRTGHRSARSVVVTFGAPQRHGDRYRRAWARDLRRAIAAMRQVRRRVFAPVPVTHPILEAFAAEIVRPN
jgi:hypothetical protein